MKFIKATLYQEPPAEGQEPNKPIVIYIPTDRVISLTHELGVTTRIEYDDNNGSQVCEAIESADDIVAAVLAA